MQVFLGDGSRTAATDPVASVKFLTYFRNVYKLVAKDANYCDQNRLARRHEEYNHKLESVIKTEREYCAMMEHRTDQLQNELKTFVCVAKGSTSVVNKAANRVAKCSTSVVNKATERLELAHDRHCEAEQSCMLKCQLLCNLKAACSAFEGLFSEAVLRRDRCASLVELAEKFCDDSVVLVGAVYMSRQSV